MKSPNVAAWCCDEHDFGSLLGYGDHRPACHRDCGRLLASSWLGKSVDFPTEAAVSGGIFGTAVATMGMLMSAAYILAMDTFGPITDNAGGIVEMSDQPESVREVTDALDSVGNTPRR